MTGWAGGWLVVLVVLCVVRMEVMVVILGSGKWLI